MNKHPELASRSQPGYHHSPVRGGRVSPGAQGAKSPDYRIALISYRFGQGSDKYPLRPEVRTNSPRYILRPHRHAAAREAGACCTFPIMDDDVSLPRSTLQKAVKGGLPSGMRIASDAMDVLTLCCNEFVHLVSAQSNVISDREKRSTISPEHVLKALQELGFDAFLGPVREGGWGAFERCGGRWQGPPWLT